MKEENVLIGFQLWRVQLLQCLEECWHGSIAVLLNFYVFGSCFRTLAVIIVGVVVVVVFVCFVVVVVVVCFLCCFLCVWVLFCFGGGGGGEGLGRSPII